LKVGGVKLKKNEKKAFCNSKNTYFLYCSFLLVLWLWKSLLLFFAGPLALHFQDDL
jgi:hypothetical protein